MVFNEICGVFENKNTFDLVTKPQLFFHVRSIQIRYGIRYAGGEDLMRQNYSSRKFLTKFFECRQDCGGKAALYVIALQLNR